MGCRNLAEDDDDVLLRTSSDTSMNRDEKRALLVGIVEPVLAEEA